MKPLVSLLKTLSIYKFEITYNLNEIFVSTKRATKILQKFRSGCVNLIGVIVLNEEERAREIFIQDLKFYVGALHSSPIFKLISKVTHTKSTRGHKNIDSRARYLKAHLFYSPTKVLMFPSRCFYQWTINIVGTREKEKEKEDSIYHTTMIPKRMTDTDDTRYTYTRIPAYVISRVSGARR